MVQKATFNSLSPNGRRVPKASYFSPSPNGRRAPSFPFRIYREKVQNSRSAFTGWENSICPSRVAWLPPSLGGSGLSGANFMWESLHQHGARWPLLRAYKFSPILQRLAVGHSWPLRSLRLVKSFVSCCPLRRLPSLGDHQSG